MSNNTKLKLLVKYIILSLSRMFDIDLILLGYRENGILNSGQLSKTGEQYVIEHILPKLINNTSPVIFDIGGDTGESSIEIAKKFPKSKIFTFEPNPAGLKILIKNVQPYPNIVINKFGFGSKKGKGELYHFRKYQTGLVSSSKESLSELYKIDSPIDETSYAIDTIDSYCTRQKIKFIDFLKVDVEGKELEVLIGANKMIMNNKISLIQFEFNNFNVVNRIFIRDFYKLLQDYNFYRLKKQELLPLGEYDSINEVFKYQNILAIPKSYDYQSV